MMASRAFADVSACAGYYDRQTRIREALEREKSPRRA